MMRWTSHSSSVHGMNLGRSEFLPPDVHAHVTLSRCLNTNTEVTMHMPGLTVIAICAGMSGMLGTGQATLLINEENTTTFTTTTSTSTSTTTVTLTASVTCTAVEGSGATTLEATASLAHVSTAPDEMADGGKEYVLQGCFAHSPTDDMATVLGQNYTAPQAGDMSLSLCLKLCASAVVGDSGEDYLYVGVADGR